MQTQFDTAIEYIDAHVLRIPESGCWLWLTSMRNDGYGYAHFRGRQLKAHRFSWQTFRGPITPKDVVCHSCDVPSCVNPNHLFIGSHRDNVNDKVAKNRQSKGERNGGAKITDADARAIKIDIRSQSLIAKHYGISQPTVSEIKCGKIWRHV